MTPADRDQLLARAALLLDHIADDIDADIAVAAGHGPALTNDIRRWHADHAATTEEAAAA